MEVRKLAHLADIQLRKGVRHQEYISVFERVYRDLRTEKPYRIYLAGDIFHNKIDMSPNLISVISDFFIELSTIAPVDIIPGNHDLNLSQLSQGDSILSIVKLLHNGHVVRPESKVDYWQKKEGNYGIYYFPESGFYDISETLVYGHYSCIDGQILKLSEKEKGKTYVALYHGQVYESINDNGSVNLSSGLLKVSAFDNFDIVAMGDIHEHQSFRKDKSMAYCGSLIQQGYGESIEKGYLIWDLENKSFRKKYIPNDYGFAKISISHGEIWEERLRNIQFSNDKEKTKVYVEWEDYEENYSVEKEEQIIRFLKDNYGCKVITVVHKTIFKDTQVFLDDDEADIIIEKDFKEVLREYIEENINEFDVDDDLIDEIIHFAKEVDEELEIEPTKNYSNISWFIEYMEVSNLFSYGETPVKFDFTKLMGLTGIFGPNYTGKTNFIKTLVWGLFQHILGGGDSKKLVNIFTNSNTAYVKLLINLGGNKYRIYRSVTNVVGRNGEIKNDYTVKYEKWVEDNVTQTWKWVDEENDKKTNEKKAVKELIIDALGTPSDFAKVVLQSENGKDNYLNSGQQDKNLVIKKFLGLQPYSDRYEHVKKNKFNQISKEQKKIGEVNEIYEELKNCKDKLIFDTQGFEKLNKEKEEFTQKYEKLNNEINLLSTQLQTIEHTKKTNIQDVENEILSCENKITKSEEVIKELEHWLSINLKKELSESISDSLESLQIKSKQKTEQLSLKRKEYVEKSDWLKQNEKKEEINTDYWIKNNIELQKEIYNIENKLPTYRGEKCLSCGHVSHQPQPEKEKQCLSDIQNLVGKIEENKTLIHEAENIIKHNLYVDKIKTELLLIASQGKNLKSELDEIARKISVLEKSKDIIENNKLVDYKKSCLSVERKQLEDFKQNIFDSKSELVKLQNNADKQQQNIQINERIKNNRIMIDEVKVSISNIERQRIDLNADIRMNKKNVESLTEKLHQIKEQEKMFKIYSIYLQCTHRDGIPANIIRKKLPAINSKIKSILKDLVEYKLELSLDKKGDVKEYFYYNEDKSDALPMDSASGAQGFLANLAIRDALHYVSRLPKSSMCIIDEGFGKLDPEITINMQEPLNYLKNKYRNVFVVTHKDVVKDFMDNIIVVSKSKKDISEENQQKYSHAWTTQITIK